MWILQLLNHPTSLWPAGYIGAGYAPYEGVLLMGEWVLTSGPNTCHWCPMTWATAAWRKGHLFLVRLPR